MKSDYKQSKKLAYLLRHDKDTPLSDDGWCDIDYVCSKLSFGIEDILRLVEEDDKGRYEINENKTKIRALYGHSIHVELGLQPVSPPDTLYHGTSNTAFSNITTVGIMPRSRNFVHLSDDIETARKVAKRHSDNIVVIQIDAKKMSEDGYIFYNPVGHAWLVKQVLIEYFIPDFNK